MSTRTILLTMHITAIASWLGADVLQHAMRHRWARESPGANLVWARMQFWLHDRYYAVVAVVILCPRHQVGAGQRPFPSPERASVLVATPRRRGSSSTR
jgi:hypothetical protein